MLHSLIKMACEQLAYTSVKLAKKNALSAAQLAAVKKIVDDIGLAYFCYLLENIFIRFFQAV